ncbi:hypothetical protein HGRIS_003475 [Hohenbuehelia grisea]|uniref:Uncharacterized protein n=1 Tax=Hohenbuehelia grisea TaxID=104357 RepID=A0ABR3JGH5_9AGAR
MEFFKSIKLSLQDVSALKDVASSTMDRSLRVVRSQLTEERRVVLSEAVATKAKRLGHILSKDLPSKLPGYFERLGGTLTPEKLKATSIPGLGLASGNSTISIAARPLIHTVPYRLMALFQKVERPKLPMASPTVKAVTDSCAAWTKTTPVVAPPSVEMLGHTTIALGLTGVVLIVALALILTRKKTYELEPDDPFVDDIGVVEEEVPIFEAVSHDVHGWDSSAHGNMLPTFLAFLSGLAITFHKTTTISSGWSTSFNVTTFGYASYLMYEAIMMAILSACESDVSSASSFMYAIQWPISILGMFFAELEAYLCTILVFFGNIAAACPTGDEEDDDEVFVYVGISSPWWFRLYHKILELTFEAWCGTRSTFWRFIGFAVGFGLSRVTPDLNAVATDVLFDLSGFRGYTKSIDIEAGTTEDLIVDSICNTNATDEDYFDWDNAPGVSASMWAC